MSKEAPTYICWHEQDFIGDRLVVRMTPHQRLMYRALCQVARFCDTQPYLPDDDNELFVLADADSLEHWQENRDAVLAKFQRITIDGKPERARAGAVAIVPPHTPHSVRALSAGRAIVADHPSRPDF